MLSSRAFALASSSRRLSTSGDSPLTDATAVNPAPDTSSTWRTALDYLMSSGSMPCNAFSRSACSAGMTSVARSVCTTTNPSSPRTAT